MSIPYQRHLLMKHKVREWSSVLNWNNPGQILGVSQTFLCSTASLHIFTLTPKILQFGFLPPLFHGQERPCMTVSLSVPKGCPSCSAWVADCPQRPSHQISCVFFSGLLRSHPHSGCLQSVFPTFLSVSLISFSSSTMLLFFSFPTKSS